MASSRCFNTTASRVEQRLDGRKLPKNQAVIMGSPRGPQSVQQVISELAVSGVTTEAFQLREVTCCSCFSNAATSSVS